MRKQDVSVCFVGFFSSTATLYADGLPGTLSPACSRVLQQTRLLSLSKTSANVSHLTPSEPRFIYEGIKSGF